MAGNRRANGGKLNRKSSNGVNDRRGKQYAVASRLGNKQPSGAIETAANDTPGWQCREIARAARQTVNSEITAQPITGASNSTGGMKL